MGAAASNKISDMGNSAISKRKYFLRVFEERRRSEKVGRASGRLAGGGQTGTVQEKATNKNLPYGSNSRSGTAEYNTNMLPPNNLSQLGTMSQLGGMSGMDGMMPMLH